MGPQAAACMGGRRLPDPEAGAQDCVPGACGLGCQAGLGRAGT